MDLGLLPADTMDKSKSVIVPSTRVEGFMDSSNLLASRHVIEELMVGRVSKAKTYNDYIENSEFEIRECLEWEIFL